MTQEIPMVEARKRLTSLPEAFEQNPKLGGVTVTRRGKPVMTILSQELYEAMMETMELMSDPEQMQQLREGIAQAQAGETLDWDEFKQQLA